MSLQGTGSTGIINYLKSTLIPSVSTIRLTNIYDHELTDLGGFPACTVTLQEMSGKVLDNARNERTFNVSIKVFIDRNTQNFGTQKAENILKSTADEIILDLESDFTLGGNCIYTRVFPAKFGYIERENNNIRVMEINLECVDVNTWR